MNKLVFIFAPVFSAAALFGISGSNFMESGIPETLPEHVKCIGLSEKGEKLLRREIIEPLKNKKVTKAQMYSRCPSGITYYVYNVPSEQEPYFTGSVVDRVGCSSKTVCFFRIDKTEDVLEAKSDEEGDYLPVAEWKKSKRGNWYF